MGHWYVSVTDSEQSKRRLLLVDGEHELLAALRIKLEDVGYDVDTCRTGGEALSKSAVRNPEIVVIDTHLTDMNGIEVATRLKEHYGCPFIFLTKTSSDEYRAAAETVGALQYLAKSGHPSDIAISIRLADSQNRHLVDAFEQQRRTERVLDDRKGVEQMIGMYMSEHHASHGVIKGALQRFSRTTNTSLQRIAAAHQEFVPLHLELEREFRARKEQIYPHVLRELDDFIAKEVGRGAPASTDEDDIVPERKRTGS